MDTMHNIIQSQLNLTTRRAIREPRRAEFAARFKAEVWDKMDRDAPDGAHNSYMVLQKALWISCTENALKEISHDQSN